METKQGIIQKIQKEYNDRTSIRDTSVLDKDFPNEDELIRIIVNWDNTYDLVNKFVELYPLYYDRTNLWWGWNKKINCYEQVDEVDIINLLRKASKVGVIQSKRRTEILNALKQIARENEPKQPEKSWIQFKKEIVDIETGERFKATSNFFFTNPIPYQLGKTEDTKIIDKIFEQWVGKDNVKKLKQIIAYCLLRDYPIHRLFCLIGRGRNGKTCFERLIRKFLGGINCCSTELDLIIKSRFEITKLHKKLVCLMGETNFNELSQTSILKKLVGQDLIGFEYKGKTPFDDYNYAKIIIATNNLPVTTDKTLGFYSKWEIIDFPNQFTEDKDILQEIPEEEFENLALQCVGLLLELLGNRKFDNEGSYEERAKVYEAKSNFLHEFIVDSCEEDLNGHITKAEFSRKFKDWCRENRHREMSDTSIGKSMKQQEGYEDGVKYFEWFNDGKGGNARVWFGLKWK